MSSSKAETADLHTIAVLGVRDFQNKLYTNKDYVVDCLTKHVASQGLRLSEISIITGGATGVERMVVEWCMESGVPYRTIPPNINSYGPAKAFAIRNNHVVTDGAELVAFWDGCIEVTLQAFIHASHQKKRTTIFPLC